jgi:hypothetical protein
LQYCLLLRLDNDISKFSCKGKDSVNLSLGGVATINIHYFKKVQLPETMLLCRRSSIASKRKLVSAIKRLAISAIRWDLILYSYNGGYYPSNTLGVSL